MTYERRGEKIEVEIDGKKVERIIWGVAETHRGTYANVLTEEEYAKSTSDAPGGFTKRVLLPEPEEKPKKAK